MHHFRRANFINFIDLQGSFIRFFLGDIKSFDFGINEIERSEGSLKYFESNDE